MSGGFHGSNVLTAVFEASTTGLGHEYNYQGVEDYDGANTNAKQRTLFCATQGCETTDITFSAIWHCRRKAGPEWGAPAAAPQTIPLATNSVARLKT